MKTRLVILVTLVALMAALLPNPARAGGDDTIEKIAAGVQIFSFLRDLAGSSNRPAANSLTAMPPQAVPARQYTTAELLQMRRVVIEESQISFSGSHGWRMREILASRLRSMVSDSGKVVVVIGGKDIDYAANLHDFVQESGRYSQASRTQVPRGQWLAPTDIMKLTGQAELAWDNQQATVASRSRVSVSRRKVTARVRFILEPIDLRQGLFQSICQVEAVAERVVDWNVNGYSSRSFGQASKSSSQVEEELLYETGNQALAQLVDRLDLPRLQEVAVPTASRSAPVVQTVTGTVTLVFQGRKPCVIDVPAGKSLGVGSKILFVRAGQVVGAFTVQAIEGQTVTLSPQSGQEPADGDGFALPATP